mmetsp:Transcript_29054/g.53106  ORF Transcript_29054/g.53106 Transcript_29054/m.53106 type:complete len:214 (+) Transcript_29054:140-781(+)
MVSYYKASALLSILLPVISTDSASAKKIYNPNTDLDLPKYRETKHHYKNLRTNSGVEHVRVQSVRDDLKTLESEECAPLLSGLEASLTEILKSMDEEIIDYACNGIKLKETLAKMDGMKRDMVEQKNPCIKAAEEVDATIIKESDLASKDACAVKVQSLLDVARGGVQDLAEVRVGTSIAASTAVTLAVVTVLNLHNWWTRPDEPEAPPQESL